MNLFSSHKLTTAWIDCFFKEANVSLSKELSVRIRKYNKQKRPIIFLCIGTPSVVGDSLGPVVGTILKDHGLVDVFGTLDAPVHALNLEDYVAAIKEKYESPFIIAINAALGSVNQSGFITVKKGPLLPGKGVGKNLKPVGNLHITGVVNHLYKNYLTDLILDYSHCISRSILHIYNSDTIATQ